jgi:hypothetical protein
METLSLEQLATVAGGVQTADGYTMNIDGMQCNIGARFDNKVIGKYGGTIDSCSDMGSGGPWSQRLTDAFKNGGIVPGVVDPDGRFGTPTTPPAR